MQLKNGLTAAEELQTPTPSTWHRIGLSRRGNSKLILRVDPKRKSLLARTPPAGFLFCCFSVSRKLFKLLSPISSSSRFDEKVCRIPVFVLRINRAREKERKGKRKKETWTNSTILKDGLIGKKKWVFLLMPCGLKTFAFLLGKTKGECFWILIYSVVGWSVGFLVIELSLGLIFFFWDNCYIWSWFEIGLCLLNF